MLRFNCKGVVVLRLSKEVNEDFNVTIPPVCRVDFGSNIPVVFEYDHSKPYGFANLRRVRNCIVADIELRSEMYPPEEVYALMRMLYPAVGFHALAYLDQDLTHIKIDTISLSVHPNEDEKVEALGDKVCFLDQGELH